MVVEVHEAGRVIVSVHAHGHLEDITLLLTCNDAELTTESLRLHNRGRLFFSSHLKSKIGCGRHYDPMMHCGRVRVTVNASCEEL
jgi:hypothetical protein